MHVRTAPLALPALFLCLAATGADAAKPPILMLDRLGESQGTAKVTLATGSVSFKAKLAPLPAAIDTGTEQFQATIYKAYLASSSDPTVELPLGSLYPTTKGTVQVKTALKGDLSLLGFDRVVVVAFSSDGLHSFDVLTGALPVPAPAPVTKW
jgi:hypothetical protein